MRVLIDLQGAQTESRFRGIGRYSLSLAQAMLRNAGDHEIYIAVNNSFPEGISEIEASLDGLIPSSRIYKYETFTNISWTNSTNKWRRGTSELMREAFLEYLQPDIIHISSLFEGAEGGAVTSVRKLESSSTPTAVTLYDLIPLLNQPEYLSTEWVKSWYFDKIDSLKRADLLLSISSHAREEAIQALSINAEKIVNISSAISPFFKPKAIGASETTSLSKKFGINGPFIMFSGAMEPRKNAEGLLRAFAMLDPVLSNGIKLVIAGKIADFDKITLNLLASHLQIADKVVFTGFITDDELVTLYSAAALYVFPSLHEGFGLPALEAMACGAPTIGSNTTSIPEVIGRNDALFTPTDPSDICRCIANVLRSPEYANELRLHGLAQARQFSWDKTGKAALIAMESTIAGRKKLRRIWPASLIGSSTCYDQLIKSIGNIDADHSETDIQFAASIISSATASLEKRLRSNPLPESFKWRVEGPFDSSYSLALVNRSLAMAIQERGHEVVLHSTEGPGDYEPSPSFLAANPELAQLYENSSVTKADQCDVTSRLLYPPRVSDVASRINILHAYAWEETGFPQRWVEDFNDSLQGISCLSEHVKNIMIDNGVTVPLGVCSIGVDHWDKVATDSTLTVPGKSFRFLHVSSCFPRKGVDALLKAYGQAFNSSDDVTLIIKTFSNPHNDVFHWLEDARSGNASYPDVQIIEADLTDGQLKHLYATCNVLVAPSRAEGFGLPIAEAMLMGIPVITTAWGGQLDFCNDATSWLVDYTFAPAKSHFNLSNSVWAEPNVDHLASTMRELYGSSAEARKLRTDSAIKVLRSKFKWSDAAQRLESNVRSFAEASFLQHARIGWITTWNTRCGVATYAANLVCCSNTPPAILAAHSDELTFPDQSNVIRCWHQGDSDDLEQLASEIDRLNLNALVIQFQYSFFNFVRLAAFLARQRSAGRVVVVVMHATVDAPENPQKQLRFLAESLSNSDRVLVHSINDLNRLKAIGVERNIALFPHGIMHFSHSNNRAEKDKFKLTSYGFFLPHKGLLELIEAVGLLAASGINVSLTMVNAEYPADVSRSMIDLAKRKIASLGLASRINIITRFLQDEDSLSELSKSDVIVFPYQGTGESSSGAVRYGLATRKPVAVTPLPIFDDVSDITYRLPGTSSSDIAKGLMRLFYLIQNNDPEIDQLQSRVDQWTAEHQHAALAYRLTSICNQLVTQRSISD